MKTIEEFIEEIKNSAALLEELKAVKDEDTFAAFLRNNNVDGTIEDFGKAIKAKTGAVGEINDDDVEAVAGGYPGEDLLNWVYYTTGRKLE